MEKCGPCPDNIKINGSDASLENKHTQTRSHINKNMGKNCLFLHYCVKFKKKNQNPNLRNQWFEGAMEPDYFRWEDPISNLKTLFNFKGKSSRVFRVTDILEVGSNMLVVVVI